MIELGKNNTFAKIRTFLTIQYLIIMSINQENYQDQIQRERSERDRSYREDANSPIPPTVLSSFNGLKYFPVNEKFKVTATIIPDTVGSSVALRTSSGRIQNVERYGVVRFRLDNINFELIVFRTGDFADLSCQPAPFFIPFKDMTNATETNPDGRYLFFRHTPGSIQVELDFNRAENPKNGFYSKYESLLPPAANSVNNYSFSVGVRKFEDRV